MPKIQFHFEQIPSVPMETSRVIHWLEQTAENEGQAIQELNIILCSDNYLLEINNQYLGHDYYTDIITFDHSEDSDFITGDLYISWDRVQENAVKYKATSDEELDRVMVHGLLHLLGYDDKSDAQREIMKKKENLYLSLRNK